MTNEQIKAIFLAAGFKEKDQGDGRMDLSPYVYDAARALLMSAPVFDLMACNTCCCLIPPAKATQAAPETLAWLVRDSRDGQYSAHRRDPSGWAHGYQVTELVGRAAFDQRQAIVERLSAQFAQAQALLVDIADEWGVGGQGSDQLWSRIRATLPASAEPSAEEVQS